MFVRSLALISLVRFVVSALVFVGLTGCGNLPVVSSAESDITLGSFALESPITHEESAANDLLNLAEFVELNDGVETISGSIGGETDVDVFDLGNVVPGDHVRVSVAAQDGLKSAVALFDDTGATLLVNDHQNVYLGKKGPFIDLVIRRASTSCSIAISGTPGFSSSGDYVLDASIEFPAPVPEPNPDVILLDFDGGSDVRISTRPPADVPAFDAADIDESFAGETESLIDRIVQTVREDFAPYNVTILSTSEGDVADESVTSVYFGRFDPALLGVAEGIDEYNATSGQSAIVFTDTFEAFMILRPTLGEMSQAIANVASHEIGHLLGLVHTQDPEEIMDVTASLRALMLDQDFDFAPLYQGVFPIGSQDSRQMLLDSVGGDEGMAFGKTRVRQVPREVPYDKDAWERPARLSHPFGSCSLVGQLRGEKNSGF